MEGQVALNADRKTKITLYWLEQSRSQRILWLLELLNVEYELKAYERLNMRAPNEFKDVHPLGKAPILTVEAEGMPKPLVLAESGLIVEYLVDHFGRDLVPRRYPEGQEGQIGRETEEWLRNRYYMHYSEGTIMVYILVTVLVENIKSNAPFFIKPISNAITGKIESLYLAPNFKETFVFLESQVSSSPNGGEYLCGTKLTGADIMMSFPLIAIRGRFGFTEENYPKLWSYVARLEDDPANKKGIQKIIDLKGSYSPAVFPKGS